MRKRKYQVHLFLNEEEYKRLQKTSEKLKLTMSAAIREMITEKELRERPSREYKNLRASVDRIGNNVNQITHIANITQCADAEKYEALQKEIKDLKQEIKAWEDEWL